MDPFSITVGAIGIAGIVAPISKALFAIASDIGSASKDIIAVASELNMFSQVLRTGEIAINGALIEHRTPVVLRAGALLPGLVSQCSSICKETNALLIKVKPLAGESPLRKVRRLMWIFQKSRVQYLRASVAVSMQSLGALIAAVHLAVAVESGKPRDHIDALRDELAMFLRGAELKSKELDETINSLKVASSIPQATDVGLASLEKDDETLLSSHAPPTTIGRQVTYGVLDLARAVASSDNAAAMKDIPHMIESASGSSYIRTREGDEYEIFELPAMESPRLSPAEDSHLHVTWYEPPLRTENQTPTSDDEHWDGLPLRPVHPASTESTALEQWDDVPPQPVHPPPPPPSLPSQQWAFPPPPLRNPPLPPPSAAGQRRTDNHQRSTSI